MLFRKTINLCCKDVVLNAPHFNNKCCINATIHVLSPRPTGQWPTQKSYKNRLRIQK